MELPTSMESTSIEAFSKSIEVPVFPLRIKINIKLIPRPFPKIDFNILVSPYTFGLSQVLRSAGGKLSPIEYSWQREPASRNETII